MLAKKEPSAPKEPVETVKLPDNVLASLRVQGLDAATMSQLNIPGEDDGGRHHVGRERRLCGSSGICSVAT